MRGILIWDIAEYGTNLTGIMISMSMISGSFESAEKSISSLRLSGSLRVAHRDFHADAPNEKWLTDVTEFKYYIGIEVHKVYLSAILDLYDRRIVAYKIGDHNDNPLVMNTFDAAVALEPDARPLFHSDRGFQYTSRQFCTRLKKHHMKQSMSRVAHCIDNGPMEGFWGILKREKYYGRRFTSRKDLVSAIEDYISYYNTERIQRNLHLMTPVEYHQQYYLAA